MKCQEVIELMQRYLDQDLDEMEYNQMLGHMKQCQECTELFQRLVMLSHELEQLPKVTPAYSLVDAIMPKLQQIDMETAGDTSAERPIAAALAADPVKPVDQVQVNQPRVLETTGWRKRMRGLVSTRIVGGVVAAGLVLGFFVFEQQQQNDGMKNADGMILPSGAAQQNQSAGGSKASATESKVDAGSSAATDSASPAKETSNTAGAANRAANEASPQTPKAEAPASPPAQSSPAVTGEQPKSGTQARTGASTPQDRTGAAAQAPVPSDKSKAITPNSQTQSNGAVADEPVSKQSQPAEPKQDASQSAQLAPPPVAPQGEETHATKEAPSSGVTSFAPEMSLKQGPEQPTSGITSTPSNDMSAKGLSDNAGGSSYRSTPPSSLASPDGTYTASLNSEKHVVITDRQGKPVFTSSRNAAETDTVSLLKWESVNNLTYQISSGAETTVYVINVSDKTDVVK